MEQTNTPPENQAKSMAGAGATTTGEIAAECLGVKVPHSRFLNETRIARLNEGRYEGQEIRGALHVVGPGDRVLEIGAGLGVVGAVIALRAQPEAILSFEANPELIPEIARLHALNDLSQLIELRNRVLWAGADRPASMPFHIRSSYLGSSLLNAGARPSVVVEVETADMAEVVAEFRPTVLVMDIEGGELALLEGMDLAPFRAVVLEFHPEAYELAGMRRCKTILREAGFDKVDEISTRLVWTCVRPDTSQESADPTS